MLFVYFLQFYYFTKYPCQAIDPCHILDVILRYILENIRLGKIIIHRYMEV